MVSIGDILDDFVCDDTSADWTNYSFAQDSYKNSSAYLLYGAVGKLGFYPGYGKHMQKRTIIGVYGLSSAQFVAFEEYGSLLCPISAFTLDQKSPSVIVLNGASSSMTISTNGAITITYPYAPSSTIYLDTPSNGDCNCSTKDLLWVGHKCGRKAPIDRR